MRRPADDRQGIDNKLKLRELLAGVTEVPIPAGYVRTVYDPTYRLSADKKRYIPTNNNTPTTLPEPGLPFSLVFRADPGREDVILKVASAYQMGSKRRVPPPM